MIKKMMLVIAMVLGVGIVMGCFSLSRQPVEPTSDMPPLPQMPEVDSVSDMEIVQDPVVLMYMKSSCYYCTMAKDVLDKKGVTVKAIDISYNDELFLEMTTKANGRKTVPQIFIDAHHVGGYDDLMDLEKTGQLDRYLSKEK